jgi:amino acid adenylation domain-containing protein/non-ribosomal peptide synthase protein (TIGR01720 family)
VAKEKEPMIEGYRLSPQQKHLWMLQQHGLSYSAQCAILLEGELDTERLEESVRRVIDQCEILRTDFRLLPQLMTPVQVIADKGELVWRELTHHAAEIDQLLDNEKQLLSRDVTQVRAMLAEIDSQRHLLVLTLPALCADTQSLNNLVQLVAGNYGESTVDDEETTQYVQFSEWQNELLEDEDPAGRDWWQQNPGTNGHGVILPFERGGVEPGESTEATSVAIPSIEQDEAFFLFACWQALLWRLGQQTEFSIDHVCDGRKYDELAGCLGLFAKAVPVTGRFEPGMPFDKFLDQLREVTRMAYTWQENYHQNGAVSQQKIGFEYVEQPANIHARGVAFTVRKQSHQLGNFKLHLRCVRTGASTTAELHYDVAHFDDADIKRLASQFATLVGSAVQNSSATIDELEILSEAEQHELLFKWNQTATDYDINHLVHQLFEAQVEQTPDRVAVVCGEKQLTYSELNARSNCLAHRLRRSGVGAGTPIGLYLERSIEMLVGLMGILKAGGAYVPLDSEHPAARLSLQLEQIESPVLVTQEKLAERLADFNGETICIDSELKEPESNPEPVNTPSDLCYVIYTSGSTGNPKGVGVTHRNLTNYALFITKKLQTSEQSNQLHFATVSTLSADLGNTCIFPSLISGGCLHVLEQDVVMDSGRFADYVSRQPLDVLKIVPSHLDGLLGAAEGRNVLPRKYLLLGGEMLSREQFSRISAAAGDCRIINHYGPTETTVGSLTFDASEASLYEGARSVPIGFPIANTEVYVLDNRMKPVPIGVAAELYIGGAGVASGYLNRSEQTAERFISHTFAGESWTTRLYKTGDLTRRLADGSIEFLGRIDNQVKIRGFRIELGEIEAALQRHDGVRQAVVLAREDEPGHKRLVAYIVAAGKDAPPFANLRTFIAQSLPEYMIPSAFVALDALPLTTNGKIDRRALPAPDQLRTELTNRFVAPRNTIEERLSEIWKQVLGVADVGVNDNFFELGGDSILSLQIIARASRVGLRIAPKQLFEFPTIALLAPEVEEMQTAQEETERAVGPVPLTPIQHWFFDQDLPDPHHWNMSVILDVQERLDAAAFEKALELVTNQYDVFRLRYTRQGEGWMQTMADVHDTSFTRLDMSGLPREEQEAMIVQSAAQFQSSLDLTEGPLVRVVLFELGPGQPERLLLIVHHLAIDGVTWRIFFDDLHTAYEQLIRGESVMLQRKSSSFKQWAERLVEHAQSAETRAELPYWKTVSEGQTQSLPIDFPGGVNDEASMRTFEISLDVNETHALLWDVPAVYNTQINDALLTALAQTLSDWTGSRTTLFDLEGHGREGIFADIDLSRSPGWFTTHFPVKLKLEDFGDIGEDLKSVKEQLRTIPRNGIGFGLLRYLSNEVRTQLSNLPQSSVSFNYLGRFDEVFSEAAIFRPTGESCGPRRGPSGLRQYVLEITAGVCGGTLQISWQYSTNLHRQETIERLAESFIAALESIVTHCMSPEAGGFTPSDFPEAALSQQELDKFLTAIELD